jgi:dihydrofolate reductase
MEASPDENIELVSDNPVAVVKELKKETGKDIWLCGGGALATTLFSEIDEMIVKLNPLGNSSFFPCTGADKFGTCRSQNL